jgi:hypothetical protein
MRWYGALDISFAALYCWFGFVFVPGRSTLFNMALAAVAGLMVVAGIGLIWRAKWGCVLAIVASVVLLAFTAVVLVGLVVSSAYLSGVYGALGQGMAVTCLLVAALVVEAFGLLPLFQLRFLLGRQRA